MSNITIPADLIAARQVAVESEQTNYGARVAYARALVDNSGGVLWFTDGVKMPPLIEAEKEEYYKGLKALKYPDGRVGYSNPSNAWRKVKEYALAYATEIGLIVVEKKPEANKTEADSASSGNARHTRSFSLRVLEEVGGAFKAGRRLEKEGALTAKEQQCLAHLGSALAALGIDLSTLK